MQLNASFTTLFYLNIWQNLYLIFIHEYVFYKVQSSDQTVKGDVFSFMQSNIHKVLVDNSYSIEMTS